MIDASDVAPGHCTPGASVAICGKSVDPPTENAATHEAPQVAVLVVHDSIQRES
jgi:hypothetical protein